MVITGFIIYGGVHKDDTYYGGYFLNDRYWYYDMDYS